ncbi:hypothetical protein MGH68_07885 [Erysipelothrix sp. D19-032]
MTSPNICSNPDHWTLVIANLTAANKNNTTVPGMIPVNPRDTAGGTVSAF